MSSEFSWDCYGKGPPTLRMIVENQKITFVKLLTTDVDLATERQREGGMRVMLFLCNSRESGST